jgi:tripartite-type tricarboxylate transporter receptor subunit TctC
MKLPRRQFLHLAVGAAALLAMSRIARAQAYPTRPVRFLVGAPAGGSLDIVARVMGQWLAERLGQPFVIENRAGAASIIAFEAIARAPADGYTISLIPVSMAINPSVYQKLNYDFVRDIAPIASLVRVPLVLEVNPSLPPRTVPEFIAYASANPGKLTYASAGRRCRRSRPWPNSCLATRRARGGVGAPKNTPAEIVDRLNQEINAGLADPKIKARLADLGVTAFACSPADFGRHVAEETQKWAKVVKFAGIKPE